jgi:hypothetical protein
MQKIIFTTNKYNLNPQKEGVAGETLVSLQKEGACGETLVSRIIV